MYGQNNPSNEIIFDPQKVRKVNDTYFWVNRTRRHAQGKCVSLMKQLCMALLDYTVTANG